MFSASRDRREAFADHYGSHPELLVSGRGTIMGEPLVVTKFDPATNYGELRGRRRVRMEDRHLGDTWEVVEFAEDQHGKPVQRNRIVKLASHPASGDRLEVTTRVTIGYEAGSGYLKWTAFEPQAQTTGMDRIDPKKASITLEFLPSSAEGLRVGMVHYKYGSFDFVTLSQSDPSAARDFYMANRYNGNPVPNGISVVNENKLQVYDWQAGAHHKVLLGEIRPDTTFTNPALFVELDWVEVGRMKLQQMLTRAWNPQNDIELILAFPNMTQEWLRKAQGGSTHFPEIRAMFPAVFKHGSGKTKLPASRSR